LQVHRLAVAAGHGGAVLEALERGVEQPHRSSQLVQVGAGGHALGARGIHATAMALAVRWDSMRWRPARLMPTASCAIWNEV
jgi:hypothetical protein